MSQPIAELPLASICIPAFNAERFISVTLESALRQDYPRLEIIVSDDCSTDRTPQILKEYIPKGVRVIRQKQNIGMAPNMNAVIQASSGKYFCKLDADDIIEPNYLSRIIPYLEEYPRIAFAHCACRLIDEHGTLLGHERSIHGTFIRPGLQEWPRYAFGPRAVSGFFIIRRSSFEEVGGYDECFLTQEAEDWKLERDLLEKGDVLYLDEILGSYRVHMVNKQGLLPTRTKAFLKHLADMEKNWPREVSGKEKLLAKVKKSLALKVARFAAHAPVDETHEILAYLPLFGNYLSVRVLAWLVCSGRGSHIRLFTQYKLRLRQKVKNLLYNNQT